MSNQLSLDLEVPEVHEFRSYFLLPEEVIEVAESYKNAFALKYGFSQYVKKTPHVSVNNHLVLASQVEGFHASISKFIASLKSIEIRINGFDFFPKSGTLYLNIEESPEVLDLVKRLNKWCRTNKLKKYEYTKKPHITIASAIPKDVFEKVMTDYAGQELEMKFNLKAISSVKVLKDKPVMAFQKYMDIGFAQ